MSDQWKYKGGVASRRSASTVVNGVLWQYIAVGSQGVAQIAVLAVLSRLLAPADFGLIGACMVFVGFAAMFSQLGVAPAVVQRDELTHRHIRSAVSLSLVFGALMMTGIWGIAPQVSIFYRADDLTPVLRAIGAVFVLSAPGIIPEALMQRNMKFKELMCVNVSAYILGYGLVGVALAVLGYGVWALVAAILSQSALKSIFLVLSMPVPFIPSLRVSECRDLLRYGSGFTLARGLNYAATQSDYLIVGRVLGTLSLGLYNRAYQVMMIPAVYIGQALETVLFPVMSRLQGDNRKLQEIYLSGTAMLSLVVAPTGVLMVVCAPEIIAIFLGDQWGEAVRPFQILSCGILFRTIYKLGDSLAKAKGELLGRSAREAIYLGVVLIGGSAGARWGLSGVATGVLAAVIVNYITAAQMSIRSLSIDWQTYLATHVGGIVLAGTAAVIAATIRVLCYGLGLPSFAVLLLTSISAIVSLGILVLSWPKVLGKAGRHALSKTIAVLPLTGFVGGVRQHIHIRLMQV